METLRVAVCAETCACHPAGIHARASQLPCHGFFQVHRRSAVQVVTLWKHTSKFDRHFGTHFETTHADTRTDGRLHIAGIGSELNAHAPYRRRRQFQPCAPPAAMYGRYHPPPFVRQQHRQAIGRPDTDPQPGPAGHQGIAFAQSRPRRFGAHDHGAVHLFKIRGELRRQPPFTPPRTEPMLQPLQPLPLHAPEHAGFVQSEGQAAVTLSLAPCRG